jgi:hypothetical protein
MSAREMMSQDQRTTTMSGLGTAGKASGAEITVPVGGYDVVVCPLVPALHLARGYHQNSRWDEGGLLPKI